MRREDASGVRVVRAGRRFIEANWPATLMMALLLPTTLVRAQTGAPFQVPSETQKVDFSLKNKDRRIVFLDDGEAVEVPLLFSIIKHKQINIVADLPEQGRFDVQLASKARVEIKDVITEGGKGTAVVVAKFSPVSMEDIETEALKVIDKLAPAKALENARQEADKKKDVEIRAFLNTQNLRDPTNMGEARDMYARVRAFEGKSDLLRDKLNEVAKRRPRWFDKDEKAAIAAAKHVELFTWYLEVLETEKADAALTELGLDFDRSTKGAAKNIRPMLQGAYLVATGKAADDKDAARKVSEVLTGGPVAQLRDALTVSLKCRLYAPSSVQDGNSVWYAGQRVSSRARDAATIRVQGRLDPGKGDRVDWWILLRYDQNSVVLDTSKQAGVQFDPPLVEEQGARLRVWATGDAAVDYWFELRPTDRSGQLKLIVHESPPSSDAKFPY